VPLSGGLIYTYTAGTNTPANTYTTGAGTIAHSNPIVLDSAGRVPTGEIWLLDGTAYKFVIKDAQNNLIGTYDNIVGINSNFVNYTSSQEIQTATAGQTVFTLTTMAYQPGTNSLSVFVDGVNQYGPGAQYAFVETSSTTVTFASGLHVGASVKFTTAVINNIGGVDASQVTYTAPFPNSETTNVEAKLAQIVSVQDFGAVGDGVTDDFAAFQAALTALPDSGGSLYIPATEQNIYRLSDTLEIIKPVRICGQLPTASLYVANAGTVLKFDANKIGIIFHAYNTYTSPVLGANYSIMENVAVVSAGGSGAFDGIIIKAPGVRLSNVWSWYWPRYGIFVDGTVGNAAQWRLDNCYTNANTSHGVYVLGSQPSAGVCTQLTSSNNGGWAVWDESFLGNTYIGAHAEGNTSGAYKTVGSVNSCVFIGAYTEPPQKSILSAPSIFVGGLGASLGAIDSTSEGSAINGGTAQGAPLQYINSKGVVTVGSTLGKDDSALVAMTFGASSESPTYDSWKLKFDNTNKAWFWQYANSSLFQPISLIGSATPVYTNTGLTGPVFQNGYGITNNGISSVKVRLLGTAAPTTGTYEIGDIVYNSTPAAGGYIGWVCVTAGAPGTWKTFGPITA
jgi:hypothetical protein